MRDPADFGEALAAVQDPHTPAADLAAIAQFQPSFRGLVVAHPNAYPQLVEWIVAQGDPTAVRVVANRPVWARPTNIPHTMRNAPQQPFDELIDDSSPKRNGVLLAVGVLVLATVMTVSGLLFRTGVRNGGNGTNSGAGGAVNPAPGQSAATGAPLATPPVAGAMRPPTEPLWAAVLGGPMTDAFNAVAVAPDGSIYAAGSSASPSGTLAGANPGGGTNAVLVKLSAGGQVLWSKNLGGSGDDEFNGVTVTLDGSVYAAGETNSTDGDFGVPAADGTDAVLAKFSAQGDFQWLKTYGGDGTDYFSSVTIGSGGDLIAGGATNSRDGDFSGTSEGTSMNGLVVALNGDGNVLWWQTLGGSGDDDVRAVAVAADGSVLAAGQTRSADGDVPSAHVNGYGDAMLAKLTAGGAKQWVVSAGGTGGDSFEAVAAGPHGTALVAGSTTSDDGDFPTKHANSYDAVVAQYNANGVMTWANVFGGNNDDLLCGIAADSVGNAVVVGSTTSSDDAATGQHGGMDALVASIGADGTLRWSRPYGGSADDSLAGVAMAGDGGIVVAGSTASHDGDFAGGVTQDDGTSPDALVSKLS